MLELVPEAKGLCLEGNLKEKVKYYCAKKKKKKRFLEDLTTTFLTEF